MKVRTHNVVNIPRCYSFFLLLNNHTDAYLPVWGGGNGQKTF